jgi:DMSO/TMAO reductase YedYZ molybdopterin-dependent catalytic subunit
MGWQARRNGVFDRRGRAVAGLVAGLIALVVFLGAAELVALATGPRSAPSIALGQNVINHVPQSLKEFAISHFGENDKGVLLTGIYVTLAVVAGAIGVVASRWGRKWATLAIVLLGLAASVSAATQATASVLDALPSVVGAVAALAAFQLLVEGPPESVAEPAAAQAANAEAISRRRLLVNAGSLATLGAAAYLGGRRALTSLYNATTSRAAVRLPAPASSTPEVSGTGLDMPGLAPYITPNDSFYRVDTALVVPQLSTDGYTLDLHGMVDHPARYSFAELLDMPLVERTITMVCVSNPVGGPYVGNARWLGVELGPLLERAGVHAGADQLFMTSSDGMTIGADLGAIMDGRTALLAVGMNGEPLPFEHGFPVRAIVPGFYGYASACKWLVDLEVTTYAAKKAYWAQRGYAQKAPIKLESKIDTPASFAQLPAGKVTVAGSAWRPGVGIAKVEVQVDDGPWHQASLAAVDSVDSWRLWQWTWQATSGTHSLQVRAVDADGNVQTASQAPVVPNGTSGQQSVVVTVT